MSFQYILDANVFIQAKRFYYPFDVFPGFWDWIAEQNENGTICSIKTVFDELKVGADDLADWIKKQDKDKWFLPIDDEATQLSYIEIANWVAESHYKSTAKDEFLGVADSWLIAKAKSSGITIVTQELSNPESKRKIFIPDVCKNFNINYINTIELIRTLGGKF